jgi:hypothetical protein
MGASSGTAALVPVIVGAHNLQLLENDSADLVAALYDLACGHDGASRIAKQVLAGCWERVLRREEARRPQAFGRLTSGTHQGPYLIGALRAMVEEKRWVVNQSPLRADQSGLYLYWPAAAADLISWGSRERLSRLASGPGHAGRAPQKCECGRRPRWRPWRGGGGFR